MGTRSDVNPWDEITRLRAELVELKGELQSAHAVLDGAGADDGQGMKEVAEGPQSVNYRLDARIIRYLLTHACPLGKVR